MSRILAAGLSLPIFFLQWSCVKYQPHDLNPVRAEAEFRARSLEGPLTTQTLTKFALQSNPALAVVRANVAIAEAALITAKQRINPSFSAEGGYNRTPDSTSTYAVSAAFTIETAGKRGYRSLAAQKLLEAARIAVYEAEWQVRSHLHTAILNCWAARRRADLLTAENSLHVEIAAIWEKRVALGEASNPEWNAAQAQQAASALSLRSAQNEIAHALVLIADAAGLPVTALETKPLELPEFETVDLPGTLPLLSVQRAGLLHRADIRRSLVEFEAADARLRLALANQYPNITLSPSYAFQEGFAAYTLGSVIESLPVLHRNQGPIAEQEAARLQMEAQFEALQAKAIGEMELALRQYTSAADEWRAIKEKMTFLQQEREAAMMTAFRAGEKDRLDVAHTRLETVAAQRFQLEALFRAQTALIALSDAVQSDIVTNPPETTN